jgi:hypothetical protein
MNTQNDLVNANFKIDRHLWKVFKAITKQQNSDASKELRKIIIKYIQSNENLIKY